MKGKAASAAGTTLSDSGNCRHQEPAAAFTRAAARIRHLRPVECHTALFAERDFVVHRLLEGAVAPDCVRNRRFLNLVRFLVYVPLDDGGG